MQINYKAFQSLIYQRRAGKISKALLIIEWGAAQESQGIAVPEYKREREAAARPSNKGQRIIISGLNRSKKGSERK